MAAIDLLFTQAPATGHPVNLLFGGEGTDAPDTALATLHGVLPVPPLNGVLLASTLTGAALAGVIPVPTLHAELLAGSVSFAVLAGVLPPVAALQGQLLVGDIVAALLEGVIPAPALQGEIRLTQSVMAFLSGVIPPVQLIAAVAAQYLSNTDRPVVGEALSLWQKASLVSAGTQDKAQATAPAPAGYGAAWTLALPLPEGPQSRFSLANKASASSQATFQTGVKKSASATNLHSDALRSVRHMLASAFQAAERAQTAANRQRHQDGIRNYTSENNSLWQEALRNMTTGVTGTSSPALWLIKGWNEDHQNAMRPPAGMYVRPVVTPPKDVCYSPDPNILFWQALGNDLVFICERHVVVPPVPGTTVVVPVLRTYVTINSITLRRVDGDVAIPTYAFQMSLDVDSWTWSWSASVPADALPLVQPGSDGEPVEVEALVNGVPYRLYAEGVSRQRQFGQARIAVKGRGKAAMLDAPYAPVLNFGNAQARTAQQLMTDVLMVNGVGIGWAVDWNLTDWLVPGNTWASQGAYIDAVAAIAQAAGGYVQPHDTAQTLRILPRYPAAPWDWASVTPDFELPSDVVAVEGIDWTRKADYNRVFVSGVANGVLGQVTRAGTAGNSVAPMVTDALITHADAARQRGLAILSDTGQQARVTLTLPVLAETGLIKPGQFVRYLDGGQSRLGLVRSTSLAWSRPKLRQTIAVETHA